MGRHRLGERLSRCLLSDTLLQEGGGNDGLYMKTSFSQGDAKVFICNWYHDISVIIGHYSIFIIPHFPKNRQMGQSHFLNNMTRLKGDEDMPGQKKPGSVGFLQEKHLQVCTNHIKYFASGNFSFEEKIFDFPSALSNELISQKKNNERMSGWKRAILCWAGSQRRSHKNNIRVKKGEKFMIRMQVKRRQRLRNSE